MEARRFRMRAHGGRRQLLAFHHAHHAIEPGADAAVEVARLEARHDVVFDHALRHRVGHHALEDIAGLDLQLAVVLGDDEEDRVVDALAAELPRFLDAHRVLLDRLRLRRGNHQHDELRAFAPLEFRERLLERRALFGAERAGDIGDAGLERRDLRRCCEERKEEGDDEENRTPRSPAAHAPLNRGARQRHFLVPKSTVGGLAIAFSSSTENCGFGL